MKEPLTLVTGAPGWLGTRLVESLVAGLADVPGLTEPRARGGVRCLVHRGADASALRGISKSVEVVEGDLTDAASLREFVNGAGGGTLFHSAAVIHPTQGTKQFTRVNVDGTRSLTLAAREAGVRRMVHVSSNSPIGTNPDVHHVFDETAAYNPYMGYGKSKMRAEQIVDEAGRSGALQTVIVRCPWFYGPGQPPRQALFFSMIKNGRAPIVGGGDNRRSMAYIDNICQGLLLAAKAESARGATYWIADRKPYSMNEIVDTIERVLERDFKMEVARERLRLPGVVSDAARVADALLQGVGIYHQKIHVLSEMNKTIACTIDKAARELGYDPKIDLEEGMRRSVRWMLEHGQTL